MATSIAAVNFFMPVFAFLLVFIVVYAILMKTKVLGENAFIHFFVSLLLAAIFIVNLSLVDFIKFSSSWFVVFVVCIFLVILLISFTHGKVDVIMKPWVAWVLVAALIIFFIFSAAHVFSWVINWSAVGNWFSTDWFGFILLLVIAGIVAWFVSKK